MNKTELVQALAAATEQSQAAASRTLDALVRIVSEELARGAEVASSELGSFERASALRLGRSGLKCDQGHSRQADGHTPEIPNRGAHPVNCP